MKLALLDDEDYIIEIVFTDVEEYQLPKNSAATETLAKNIRDALKNV